MLTKHSLKLDPWHVLHGKSYYFLDKNIANMNLKFDAY
jgi:hypothetical protein